MMSVKQPTVLIRVTYALLLLSIVSLGGCGSDSQPPKTLQSIQITPVNPSVAAGLPVQLSATAVYSDNSTQQVTTGATWASSSTAIATVDAATGAVQSATVGTATISVSFSGKSTSTTLTVTPATLVSIAVTPASPHIAIGATQQFTATGTYTDNSTKDLTTAVSWSSSDMSVATISNTSGTIGVVSASASTTLGSTTSVSAQSGSITGSVALPVDATGYAYVVGYGVNQILQYQTLTNGSLSPETTPTVATGNVPYFMVVDHTKTHAYVVNQHDQTISQYTIGSDGSLQPLGTPVAAPGGAQYMAVDPTGRYAYATGYNDTSLWQYSIGSDGTLTSIGPVALGGSPGMIAIDPSGHYAYVVCGFNTIFQFTIGGSGQLVAMTPATVTTGIDPFAVTIDSAGSNLYVTNTSGGPGTGDTAGTITQFSIGGTGALTAVAGPTVADSNYPSQLTLHPSGHFAYIPNFNNDDISQYTVASDGSLTAMSVPTVAAGRTPSSVAVDPSGNYLYATNANGGTLSEYSIGADGSLAAVGTPLNTGGFPFWIVVVAAP